MKFGSEELHLALRAACDADDLNEAASLLYEPVVKTARYFFAKKREFFSMYTREDREDAVHDALLYMLNRLSTLAYPPNEGIPNYSYYAAFVFYGLCQSRRRLMHIANQSSTDATLSCAQGSDDDKDRSLLDFTPSTLDQPEMTALHRDALTNALRAFFSLPNEPETLVSVGFIIMNEALGSARVSLKDYAQYFNGRQVSAVLRLMEEVLLTLHLDVHILDPVWSRLNEASAAPCFTGVTEARLANRKNSIVTKMRNSMKTEE